MTGFFLNLENLEVKIQNCRENFDQVYGLCAKLRIATSLSSVKRMSF